MEEAVLAVLVYEALSYYADQHGGGGIGGT
jgi:hypothetical protein